MKKRILLAALLCFSACGAGQPKGTPKFKIGDEVAVGTWHLPGQVLEADCASVPCKYTVRYMSPTSGGGREYRKEVFDEVELKLNEPSTGNANRAR